MTFFFCMIYYNCRQEFLEPGESIVMISKLKKIQKLTSKKVQLILTNRPKLICIDPSKMVAKGSIIWSDNPTDLTIQVTNTSHFKICTVRSSQIFQFLFSRNNLAFQWMLSPIWFQPKKILSFEDAKQRAWQWKKAIEGFQRCWIAYLLEKDFCSTKGISRNARWCFKKLQIYTKAHGFFFFYYFFPSTDWFRTKFFFFFFLFFDSQLILCLNEWNCRLMWLQKGE